MIYNTTVVSDADSDTRKDGDFTFGSFRWKEGLADNATRGFENRKSRVASLHQMIYSSTHDNSQSLDNYLIAHKYMYIYTYIHYNVGSKCGNRPYAFDVTIEIRPFISG